MGVTYRDDCMRPRCDERLLLRSRPCRTSGNTMEFMGTWPYEAVQQGTETAESTCTRVEGDNYMRFFVLGYIAWCSCAGCLSRPVED